jgi:acrylyl-CoA reductase (NADPH)
MTPAEKRTAAWSRLAQDLPESFYEQSATEIRLEQTPEFANAIINNQAQGRTLVKIA